jgi:hypothetical protein
MSSGMSPDERGLSNHVRLARLAKGTYVRVYFVIGGFPTVCSGTLEELSRGYVSVRDALGSTSDIPLHTITYVRVPERDALADLEKAEKERRRARLLWFSGGLGLFVVLVRCMMHFPHHRTAFPYVTLIVGIGVPVGYLIGTREADRDAVRELSSMVAPETRWSTLVHVAMWSAVAFTFLGLYLFANRPNDVGALSAAARVAGSTLVAALGSYGATVATRRIFASRSRWAR